MISFCAFTPVPSYLQFQNFCPSQSQLHHSRTSCNTPHILYTACPRALTRMCLTRQAKYQNLSASHQRQSPAQSSAQSLAPASAQLNPVTSPAHPSAAQPQPSLQRQPPAQPQPRPVTSPVTSPAQPSRPQQSLRHCNSK